MTARLRKFLRTDHWPQRLRMFLRTDHWSQMWGVMLSLAIVVMWVGHLIGGVFKGVDFGYVLLVLFVTIVTLSAGLFLGVVHLNYHRKRMSLFRMMMRWAQVAPLAFALWYYSFTQGVAAIFAFLVCLGVGVLCGTLSGQVSQSAKVEVMESG